MSLFKPLAYRHPTWQSHRSRDRVAQFLLQEETRVPGGLRVNIGSASRRFDVPTVNLDLAAGAEVDIQADAASLPFKDNTVDSVVCTGVLEHVKNPHQAVQEMSRVLTPGGRLFLEVAFIQTQHASPLDYCRWTSDGLRQLLCTFRVKEMHVVAGPASALAWLFQETMAMIFSGRSLVLYKIGLRVFGYLAFPLSWMDWWLEQHPMAHRAASAFAILALKPAGENRPQENHAAR
jgi:SAM-dependent methyltransferase